MSAHSIDRRGLAAAVGAYGLWGLLPLYFRLVASVGAGEIVAQRVLWSVVLLVAIVVGWRRWPQLRAVFRQPRIVALLGLSALLIGANWLIYVWAVLHHQVLAASLAYFLNPLINVAMGVALLGERLTRVQAVAVGLAAIGVGVLALGAGGGLWISLTLALSFAFYGLIRKLAPVGAIEGLSVETALLAPVALGFLWWSAGAGGLAFGGDAVVTGLLILAGAVTTIPLILFGVAARRLQMSTLGLMQFLAPSLQFMLALTVFGETLSWQRALCFGFIWAGLAIYVWGTVAEGRRVRRAVPAE